MQYAVYTFDTPAAARKGRASSWKRELMTEDRQTALTAGRALFKTGQFRQVEVKRKYVCPGSEQPVDATIRVWRRGFWFFR